MKVYCHYLICIQKDLDEVMHKHELKKIHVFKLHHENPIYDVEEAKMPSFKRETEKTITYR